MPALYSIKNDSELLLFECVDIKDGYTKELSIHGQSVPIAKFDTFFLYTPNPFSYEVGFDYFLLWDDGQKDFIDFHDTITHDKGDGHAIECRPRGKILG